LFLPEEAGQDDGTGPSLDIVPADLGEPVVLEDGPKSSPLEEITAVPVVPPAGQAFNEADIAERRIGTGAPGLFEVNQDDPPSGGQGFFGGGEQAWPDPRGLLMQGKGDDNALERARGERQENSVGADEHGAGMPRGGIFRHPEVDVQSEDRASLFPQPAALRSRPAADIQHREKAAGEDKLADSPPDPSQRPIENSGVKEAGDIQPVPSFGHALSRG